MQTNIYKPLKSQTTTLSTCACMCTVQK